MHINCPAAALRWRLWWQDPAESAKLGIMEKTFQAVYQGGVLRPEEPLPLEESQRVTVLITDTVTPNGDMAGYFTPHEWVAAASDPISWDEAKQALSGISGSLSDAVIALRQER
jgi:hypothetical protein